MYDTVDSVPRADISTLLMEAVDQEKHFVGQTIMPVYDTATIVGRYPKFKKQAGELLTRERSLRGATGTYNEIERKFEWDSFQTQEYGLEERVDDVVALQMENFFDAEALTGKLLMRALMLDYEVDVASAVMDPTMFAVNASSIAYTEANLGTFDVPHDINAVIEALTLIGETPNTIIMSLSVWNRIRRSKALQTYLYGFLNATQGGANITTQIFGEAFMIPNVVVTKQSYNLSIKGLADNYGPVWGNSYLFIGNVAGGDFLNGGIGRTIIWDADSPGGLFTTESYRDEKRRGTMIRVRSNRVLKIINPAAAALLETQWA